MKSQNIQEYAKGTNGIETYFEMISKEEHIDRILYCFACCLIKENREKDIESLKKRISRHGV